MEANGQARRMTAFNRTRLELKPIQSLTAANDQLTLLIELGWRQNILWNYGISALS